MSRVYFGTTRDGLEFTDSPVTSAAGYNTETRFMVRRNDTGVSNPDPDIMGTVQDTGIDRTTAVITGIVEGDLNRVSTARRFIRNAMIRDQVTATNRFGNMGFQIDHLPEWNVAPSADRGAMVINGEIGIVMAEGRTRAAFILNVLISGLRGTAPNFRWA